MSPLAQSITIALTSLTHTGRINPLSECGKRTLMRQRVVSGLSPYWFGRVCQVMLLFRVIVKTLEYLGKNRCSD